MILLVVSLGGVVPAAVGQTRRPEPLPADVSGAWHKVEARVGWREVNRLGVEAFRIGDEGKREEVPALPFDMWLA